MEGNKFEKNFTPTWQVSDEESAVEEDHGAKVSEAVYGPCRYEEGHKAGHSQGGRPRRRITGGKQVEDEKHDENASRGAQCSSKCGGSQKPRQRWQRTY
eukprot:6248525-Amphidinium_carterae.2